MMKIGNVTLEGNVFLAPMAGITDYAFRTICHKFGAALSYTEMVSAKALSFSDKKTIRLMDTSSIPSAVQIFGSDPEIISKIIPQAEKNALFTDINMGCPAPKITSNGEGSALLKKPALAGKIISAACKSAIKPVTVKIRMGWDDDSINAVEIAKIAEECGASAVTVHGRTREQFYSGNANREIIKKVCDAVSIPVIANGDIFTAEDARNVLRETGAAAVMIGRGAQGNPFLFKQINELLNEGEVKTFPTADERISVAIEHISLLCKYKGDYIGTLEARKHAAWYIKGMIGAAAIRNEINCAVTPDEIFGILNRMRNGGYADEDSCKSGNVDSCAQDGEA